MIVVVMGVTGAGKTTVGRLLARELGCDFLDADDYHPAANVAKMRAGPGAHRRRSPAVARPPERGARGVRSAHRRRRARLLGAQGAYRDQLVAGLPDSRLVYLRGTKALIAARLDARRGHYMNPALLDSQFAALEEPDGAIVADIGPAPEAIAAAVLAQLA